MTCPKCGSTEVRSSKRAELGDFFHRMRGHEAFRCRKCRERFFVSEAALSDGQRTVLSKSTNKPVKLMSVRKKQRIIRQLIVVSIFAVAFALFLFFLRYLTTPKMPPSDSGAVRSPIPVFLT